MPAAMPRLALSEALGALESREGVRTGRRLSSIFPWSSRGGLARGASPSPALHGVAHVCPIAAKDGGTALPYRMGRRCQCDVKFRAVEATGAHCPISRRIPFRLGL